MRNILIIVIILLFVQVSFSQSSSVYSRYGIGDLQFGYSAKMIGIGEIGTTQLDPDHILLTNPASWSAINKTRIEFGLGYKGIFLSDDVKSKFTSETEFNGFTFGFPVSSEYGIGVAAGLVPLSRISYKVKSDYAFVDSLLPDRSILFEGKGGISKLFVGSSVELPFGVLAGITLDYYFGNLRYLSTLSFNNSSYYSSTYENKQKVTGYGTTIGFISPNLVSSIKSETINDIRFGASVNYFGEFGTDTTYVASSGVSIDTFSVGSTNMQLPIRVNAGLNLLFKEVYNVNLDYSYQSMSEYKFNDKNNQFLRNSSKISAGIEFKPKRTIGMTTWEQIIWRAGFSYEQTQYFFNNTGIDQFSVFGGFSYPMGIDNSVDISIQYSKRGTTENGLINENFVKLNLGLSFGELWFTRYEK